MATVKKTIKKAQYGVKTQAKPSSTDSAYVNKYKNIGLATEGRGPATKLDSALYDFGFRRGVNKEKAVPGEGTLQRFGRWEGQNAKKTAVPKKKMKNGGSFPDLSGDKKVTQKDVLIAKGVLPKPAKKAKNGMSMKAKSGKSMKKCKYGCN